MNRFRKSQSGFTLVELLVVIAIIGVLVGLLLPAVQAAREAARRMSCSNNFKQIGLGVHDYHDAFKQLPQHKTGTGKDPATGAWWDGSNNTNQGQLSWLVPILPFIEQQPLWEKISNPDPYLTNGTLRTPTPWPAFGPKCGNFDYPASMTEINAYRCPSDPGIGLPAQGRTNYACCLGDSISKLESGDRDQNLVATSGDSEWAWSVRRSQEVGFP
jgi:prepilin-type N-terminal cleavage/methylation domain-containing protein